MVKSLKLTVASLAVAFCLVPALPAMAAEYDPFEGACTADAAKDSAVCKTNGSNPLTGKDGILYRVSQIIAFVASLAAVIVIIVAGLMYITAGGDSNKASSARSAIVTAVIGLVVIVVAEAVITLVINLLD